MKEQEEEQWNQQPYVMQQQEVISKKKKSKTWLFVILVIVLIGIWDAVTSAFIDKYLDEKREVAEQQENTSQSREEVIKQQALDYLKERYEEEFVIESYRGQGYAYDYINMYAYPKEHQDEAYKFKLQGRYNEEGALEFTDSYVMIKLRDDYEAYVDPIIDEYFDEYKFYMTFDSEWITSNIPADSKLEDLWKLGANQDYPLPEMHIFIGPNEDRTIDNLEKMVVSMSLNNVRCGGLVAYYSKSERYSTLVGDWNEDVTGLDISNDIQTFLIYGENNYEFTSGGN